MSAQRQPRGADPRASAGIRGHLRWVPLERYHLGCPFWSFDGWNGRLYSRDARPADRLRQYAEVFDTVEGNTTFYSVPSERTVARWRDAVGPGFRFCFKLPREITHDRMLRDVDAPLADFLRALAPLRDHLGPFLVQLPPALGPDHLAALEAFLDRLPREHAWAVEMRHPRLFEDERLAEHCDALLAERGMDRVVMDTRALRAGDARHPEVIGALHQKPDLPVRPEPIGMRPFVRWVGHPDAAPNDAYLEAWAAHVAAWVDEGLEPFFFVHTASNRRTPEVARDFHARVGRHAERAVGALPAFAGERGELAGGQLELL